MQASKKIPLEDPYVVNIVRAVYILSNVLIVGVYFYMQSKINAKKGKKWLIHASLDFASVILTSHQISPRSSMSSRRNWAAPRTLSS